MIPWISLTSPFGSGAGIGTGAIGTGLRSRGADGVSTPARDVRPMLPRDPCISSLWPEVGHCVKCGGWWAGCEI
jgi:hypothetical protein